MTSDRHREDGEPFLNEIERAEWRRANNSPDRWGRRDANAEVAAAYSERARIVLALATMARGLGLPAGLGVYPDAREWPVLYIDTPAGQVSWHISASDLPTATEPYPGKWDGHSTPKKYARLDAWLATVGREVEAARREGVEAGLRAAADECATCARRWPSSQAVERVERRIRALDASKVLP